jgi:hypothetical protein
MDIMYSADRDFAEPDLQHREWRVQNLEQCARLVARQLPRYGRPLDEYNTEWLDTMAKQAASNLRSLQRMVIVGGSHDQFARLIERHLFAFATENFGIVPQSRIDVASSPMLSLRRRVYLALRATFIAILPVSIVLIANVFVSISPEINGWLISVTIAWAAVKLIYSLEPRAGEILDSARSIVASVRETSPREPKRPN